MENGEERTGECVVRLVGKEGRKEGLKDTYLRTLGKGICVCQGKEVIKHYV